MIVSFETPKLEDFSLCILQQHNCFNCDAKIIEDPPVPALSKWRGEALDAAAANRILVGHWNGAASNGVAAAADGAAGEPWSWKVVVGANPAYDAFPMQHQLFYPTANGKSLW